MNKRSFVKSVAEYAGVSQKTANETINAAIAVITEALDKGDNVILPGFGSFVVTQQNVRNAKNPRTGETITIPARKVAKFKVGKIIREMLAAQKN